MGGGAPACTTHLHKGQTATATRLADVMYETVSDENKMIQMSVTKNNLKTKISCERRNFPPLDIFWQLVSKLAGLAADVKLLVMPESLRQARLPLVDTLALQTSTVSRLFSFFFFS